MTRYTAEYAYGWIPDLPDARDHYVSISAPVALPPSVDLAPGCPPVYDQGQLGSCTANAIGAAFDFERHRQGAPFLTPSRLFIYYNERVMEHTVASDSGGQIRDGIKTLKSEGVPPETDWPYDISQFTVKPPGQAWVDAVHNEALAYARVPQTAEQIQTVLAGGRPVVIGFTVYESFEAQTMATTGVMSMPAAGEKTLGGHAVLVVGYQEYQGQPYWKVRNSWGAGWGQGGYFMMPQEYLVDASLASDFWTVSSVSV